MIRMTKQADYGAVLLTFFAQEQGRMLSARELAQRSQLPLPTVTKILKLLTKGGLLISHRGVKGGYSLTRSPADITVEQIVTALDGPIALAQCGENAPGCEQASICPIRPGWQQIDVAVRNALTEVTLAHLVSSSAPIRSSASVQGQSGSSHDTTTCDAERGAFRTGSSGAGSSGAALSADRPLGRRSGPSKSRVVRRRSRSERGAYIGGK